ncbi:hypothetical protein EMIHUDRAFT_460244 [Emiliania huxleyi CCMP1516]|uniref:Uncharacterized protein n=2 Tax=Emiliania huxleyi TaxID=2903 RepID=A0A0D3I004_EMIH1|nr:hypothetical protein EMIHUDRAFT_460244 [Emiliania huxleyi CCMP1516]EOD04589.1 hypothetical protein EMIHUDRAFT_460244 [Emiliania huxleyi CCMP1516]|eukprot:XP_005757018.1 hypothetical protein EMIHUDRAFT_460244 [Emiliania huxleyi CCMP1516]
MRLSAAERAAQAAAREAEARGALEAATAAAAALREQLAAAKQEAEAARVAEELARREAVGKAVDEYVAAVEVSAEGQRALREERDALLGQLRDFTERAAAQRIFASDHVPDDFVDAFVSDRDGDFPSGELAEKAGQKAAQAAEKIAEAGLGNIASVASVALRKGTSPPAVGRWAQGPLPSHAPYPAAVGAPLAQKAWASWFGGDGGEAPPDDEFKPEDLKRLLAGNGGGGGGGSAEGDAFDRAAAQVAKGAAAPATNPPTADVGPAAAPRPDPAVVAATPGVPAAAEAGPKSDVRT